MLRATKETVSFKPVGYDLPAELRTGPENRVPLDLTGSPKDNVYAYMKTYGRIDGRWSYGVAKGLIYWVQPGKRTIPIMGYFGSGPRIIEPQPDGKYRLKGHEVVYYTDPNTFEVLDEWTNPVTGEKTIPFHVRNWGFQLEYSDRMQQLTFGDHHYEKGDLHTKPVGAAATAGTRPFLLPWETFSDQELSVTVDISLEYPNACDPATWPKESTGEKIQFSEHWTYFANKAQLEDRNLMSSSIRMMYCRVGPYAPWMLMGQRPGWLYYQLAVRKYFRPEDMPDYLLAYYEKHDPQYFDIPAWRTEPDGSPARNLTSWEWFAKERTPTPV